MAEVKVKVTAQNQTRTGFQQALNDAKQFGNEATRSVSIDDEAALAPLRKIQQQLRDVQAEARRPITAGEIDAVGGGAGGAAALTASESRRASTAIRGLAADLSSATSPAQAFEAVLSRVAQMVGRLTSFVVGFAVGKIITAQFDKLNTAFDQAISNAAKFSAAFQSLSKATNFDSAISSFKQLNSIADQTGETLKRLQSDRGARIANIAAGGGFTRGGPFERLRELEQSQRAAAAFQLANDSEFLLGQSGKRLGIAGDSGAEQEFDRRAKQEQELFALEQALQAARKEGNGQAVSSLKASIELTKQRFDVEDQIVQKRKEAAAAAEAMAARQQAAGTSRAIADFGADPATLLARAQERLSALENPNIAANMGLTPERAAAERKRIMLEILGLEQQVTSEIEKQKADRERAAKSLADAIEDREFAGLSPAEQQAKIEADQAALIAGIESGEIGSTEGAQRAAELARRQDALGAGGITGSAGASSLQRIGFASNEFFDTRNKKDPALAIQEGNKILQDIKKALQSSQPLVLSSNS
jgi:hypothetical protein